MKKFKTFSSALAMLICSLTFGQETNVSETLLEKTSIEKNESPKILLGKKTLICQPLYVIDGIVSNDSIFKSIKPESIKSINVLKGNGATAIYGQKAQNGVIIIESKNLTKKQLRQIKKASKKALKEKNKEITNNKNL